MVDTTNYTDEYQIPSVEISQSLLLVKNIAGIPLYAVIGTTVLYVMVMLAYPTYWIILPYLVQLFIFKILSLKDPFLLKFTFLSFLAPTKIVP